MVYGQMSGPFNASALITSVSNTNEWNEGATGYPSGQNYYYFGVQLNGATTGNKRAPLEIAADQLQFLTGPLSDAQAGMFSENGNLILGSTLDNGTGKLQVTGNITATGTIQFSGLTSDSSQTRVLVSDASGNLFYRTASSLATNDLLRSSLAVNGTITAKQLKLRPTDWPDYVFDSAYRLPSLPAIENYIRRQHHLPGIPSAEEVRNNGADVGDNQAALLKKIEELTLYNIDANKRIDEQQVELKEQAEELRSLYREMTELKKVLITKTPNQN